MPTVRRSPNYPLTGLIGFRDSAPYRDSLAAMIEAKTNEFLAEHPSPKLSKRQLTRILARAWQKTLPTAAAGAVADMEKREKEFIRESQVLERRFRRHLYRRWRKPLDSLYTLCHASVEAGQKYFEDGFREPLDPNDPKFQAIGGLHARGCRVAWEVHTLLQAGFADGAKARWRTLHEVSVVALVLARNAATLAERYLDHERIQAHRAALQYQVNCRKLRMRPFTPKAMAAFESTRQALISKYGKAFGEEYGWAAPILPRGPLTFAAIEASAGMDGIRPVYRFASEHVHAGSRGLEPEDVPDHGGDFLLAGPSESGLHTPAVATCQSLLYLASALDTARPSLDSQLMSATLKLLGERAIDSFSQTAAPARRKRNAR